MEVFKRNKRYRSLLIKVDGPKYNGLGTWVNDVPMFTGNLNGQKVGLYPVFNVKGPHGRFTENHQEFRLINMEKEDEQDTKRKDSPRKRLNI
jgi:hypothetical protein